MVRCYPSWHAIRFITTKHADHHEVQPYKICQEISGRAFICGQRFNKSCGNGFYQSNDKLRLASEPSSKYCKNHGSMEHVVICTPNLLWHTQVKTRGRHRKSESNLLLCTRELLDYKRTKDTSIKWIFSCNFIRHCMNSVKRFTSNVRPESTHGNEQMTYPSRMPFFRS